MDLDEARAFMRDNHRAILCTLRRDGRPQMSRVAVAVDDDGYAIISSRETAIKAKNIRSDPSAAAGVMDDNWYGRWIQVDGTASIDSLPDAMDGLVDYYRRVAGDHPDWDDYRTAMKREQRCLIRISLDRAGPDPLGAAGPLALGHHRPLTDDRRPSARPDPAAHRRRRSHAQHVALISEQGSACSRIECYGIFRRLQRRYDT